MIAPFIVAKRLASQGLAVFPVRGKQPLTARGVYSATSNLNLLAKMDGWRNADGCGLATGEVSGVDVLDVDLRGGEDRAHTPGDRKGSSHDDGRDGFAALAQLGALPSTLCAQTPRNGRHFYFRHIPGGRSRKLCADGSVEWFSTGKLVVVPPAPGRAWLNCADIAEAPEWLRALVLSARHTPLHDDHAGDFSGPLVSEPSTDRQVPRDIYLLIINGMRKATSKQQRRVRGLWANLAAKSDHRNDGLNYTAWRFSEFVETGELKVEVAAKLLWLACEANGYIEKDGADVVKEVINRVLGERG